MPVGKGSIERAVKAQNQEAVEKEENAAVEVAGKKEAVQKKAAAKKTAPKKEKESIHEEKFQVVSHIQSDLPVYLL